MKSLSCICLALVLLCLSTMPAYATPDSNELSQIVNLTASLDQKYPAGSIRTAEQAESALKESTATQVRLQSWYERADKTCQGNFFVNNCLNEIKEQRRLYIVVLQRIALEAKALQRKLRIDQLDRDLAERQAKP
ncbi:hypothetical protein [Undibacterium sp. TS12]|uniref:hypothetical protein n=1 Tax=Undibacterium sp. TS12 TaxID=2908202 RepID=UPI001F4CB23A|nr:hypothetical protein [Undibacterium sp. TS12]MCH8621733.1 hypothetical protein [Undibacterium sp. TS12]